MMYDDVIIMAKAFERCGKDKDCAVSHLRTLETTGVTGKVGFHGDTIVERGLVLTSFEKDSWKAIP